MKAWFWNNDMSAADISVSMLGRSWSPNSTYLYWDFYLLSWWWQPLWSGGLLFQLPVLPEKASQLRFLFKISVSCTWRLSKGKKIRKRLGKTLQKTCVFQASQPSGSAQIRNSWNGPAQIRKPEMGLPRWGRHIFSLDNAVQKIDMVDTFFWSAFTHLLPLLMDLGLPHA